jgi:serine/threonine protein kinase/tetratricopeptide (TPR) repeat protein/TolB-like protein
VGGTDVEGRTLGNFEIKRKLGEGGMGAVYEALDRRLQRRVAVKVLREQFASDEERLKRFLQEARTAAAVSHANIAVIHQIDESDGVTFIAMEFIEGKPLREVIAGHAVPIPEALRIALEIAQGLARAHESNIVHRDLKPDNVMVGDDGSVKILDFGLAKLLEDTPDDPNLSQMATMPQPLTREGKVFGTAAYMSPEQARGKLVDKRSDIFSFGILLYELVTGRVPFVGETITDTISAILRDPAVPAIERNAEVPLELDRIIGKCLQKAPAERYQDTRDLVVDLRQLLRETDGQSMSVLSGGVTGATGAASVHSHSGYASHAPSSGSGPVASTPQATTSTITVPAGPLARVALLAVVVVAAAALVLVGMLVSGQFRSDPREPRGVAARGSAPEPAANTLAVHPFANLRDPDDPERMGQILQELIITDLTEVPGLQVYSSQRLFDVQKRLTGNEQRTFDPEMAAEVAERAGAASMLTGTLSQLGERWILTCQLVDVASGTIQGSKRIDGEDLYTLVDELTAVVRGDLPLATAASNGTPLRDKTGVGSIEAYQIYLAGMEKLNHQDFEEAIALFDSTITVAPDFSRAYYPLAIAHWWANHDATEAREPLEKLLDGELRTTERERRLATAALALVERDWDEALVRYRELTEEYPDEKEAWYGYGESHYHHPQPDKMEALAAFHRAVELDPTFDLGYRHIFDVYRERGLEEEEVALARLLVEQDPEDPERHSQLVEAYLRSNDTEAGAEQVTVGRERFPDYWTEARVLNLKVLTLMRTGRLQQAITVLDELLAAAEEDQKSRVMGALCETYTNLYAYEKALSWLDRAHAANPEGGPELLGRQISTYFNAGWIADGLDMADDMADELGRTQARFAPFADMARFVFLASRPEPDSMLAAIERFQNDVKMAGFMRNAPLEARRVAAWGMTTAGNHELAYDLLELTRAAADSGRATVDDLAALGWNAISRQNYLDAERYFLEALARAPTSFLANSGLAVLRLVEGRNQEALEIAEIGLIGARPEDPSAVPILVDARMAVGDLAGAQQAVEEALDRFDLPETRRRLLVSNSTVARPLGVVWLMLQRGHEAEARALVARAHADGGADDAETLYALGYFRLLEGEADRALDHFHRGLRMARPGSMAWADNVSGKAIAYLESGRPQDADRELRVLFENGPVGVVHHRLMAYVLAEAGRHEEAEPFARTAADRDPSGLNLAALAWVLVSGAVDVARGAELAESAVEIGAVAVRFDPLMRFKFVAPPEHTLGVAALRENRLDAAISHLEDAAEAAPSRAAIQEDLEEARTRLAERQG